ncbi:MAG: hypothetical protein CW694_06390 [Candidatus Syntrophoarchaeum sp. WYZ-LMO15]|nr:MAG: hypothetical protein CW694_06390 [Candidatus Syntrophoarchaeum sp. WYZ-LMO15]
MKIRLEITDEDGVKTSIEAEGDIRTERVAEKLIKFMQDAGIPVHHLSGSSSGPHLHSDVNVTEDLMTLKERMRLFLKYEFSNRWFTSSDVKSSYEAHYGVGIGLSTVSTYLARLYREGFLLRRGTRKQMEYRLRITKCADEASEIPVDSADAGARLRG